MCPRSAAFMAHLSFIAQLSFFIAWRFLALLTAFCVCLRQKGAPIDDFCSQLRKISTLLKRSSACRLGLAIILACMTCKNAMQGVRQTTSSRLHAKAVRYASADRKRTIHRRTYTRIRSLHVGTFIISTTALSLRFRIRKRVRSSRSLFQRERNRTRQGRLTRICDSSNRLVMIMFTQ